MTGPVVPPVVLVVGSLHHDIMIEADRLPVCDETAVGRRWSPKFGGKGGNQAVAARRHGVAVRMAGAVGDDAFGRFLRGGLEAAGIDHRFVATVPGAGSGMSVAIVDAAGDYAAVIVPGANLAIDAHALRDPAVWDGVALLVLQNEVPEAVNLVAAAEAGRRGIPRILNAAPARALSGAMIDAVDILVVNAVEAAMMGAGRVDDLDGAAAAAAVLSGDYPIVIVTAGAHGLAVDGASGERFRLPAERVAVVGTHGAGDAFIGALAAQMVTGDDLRLACEVASRMAARHVAGQAG